MNRKEAEEKQIPQAPEIVNDYCWACPRCNKAYELDYDEFNYCPKCGQRISWKIQKERRRE